MQEGVYGVSHRIARERPFSKREVRSERGRGLAIVSANVSIRARGFSPFVFAHERFISLVPFQRS